MKDQFIKQSDGKLYVVPMFDPVVAEHFSKESSYIDALLTDINARDIYAPLFYGKKDLVFLDIGANIGLVSIYALPSCKRIVACEPDPNTHRVLQAMTINHNKIEVPRIALCPTIGQTNFYQNDLNTTASSTVNTYGFKTTVMGWTLMETLRICQLEYVDVCKIDAEGGEGESLTFDQLRLAKDIIHTYYIETHNCPKSTWEYKIGRLVSSLSQLGYYKMSIDGMTLTASRP